MNNLDKSNQSSDHRQLTIWESPENPFEHIKRIDESGQEYWLARELMVAMQYERWRTFTPVISRAVSALEKAGNKADYHMVDQHHMIETGKGAKRKVADLKLSRLACYFIAMNGDPQKDAVSLGQAYFVIQTRRQELTDNKIAVKPPVRQTKAYRALLDSGYTQQQAVQQIESRQYSKDRFKIISGIWYGRGGDVAKLADRSTLRATGKHVWQWKTEWHIKESPRNYFSTALLNILSMVEFLAANLSTGRDSHGTDELAQDIDRATSYVDFEGLQRDYPEMFVKRPALKAKQPQLLRDGS